MTDLVIYSICKRVKSVTKDTTALKSIFSCVTATWFPSAASLYVGKVAGGAVCLRRWWRKRRRESAAMEKAKARPASAEDEEFGMMWLGGWVVRGCGISVFEGFSVRAHMH